MTERVKGLLEHKLVCSDHVTLPLQAWVTGLPEQQPVSELPDIKATPSKDNRDK